MQQIDGTMIDFNQIQNILKALTNNQNIDLHYTHPIDTHQGNDFQKNQVITQPHQGNDFQKNKVITKPSHKSSKMGYRVRGHEGNFRGKKRTRAPESFNPNKMRKFRKERPKYRESEDVLDEKLKGQLLEILDDDTIIEIIVGLQNIQYLKEQEIIHNRQEIINSNEKKRLELLEIHNKRLQKAQPEKLDYITKKIKKKLITLKKVLLKNTRYMI